MTTKLHIGNLPRNSTLLEIEALFRPFGLVASVAITKDPVTGANTGCGTVEMDNESDALSAVDRLNFKEFGGQIIGVSRKCRI